MAAPSMALSFTHLYLRRFLPLNRRRFTTFTSLLLKRPLSTSSTPYPLQYEMIISRPSRQQRLKPPSSKAAQPSHDSSDSDSTADLSREEPSFEDWVDKKLTENAKKEDGVVDKSKRKYYNKRRRRMYGDDSEDEMMKLREKSEVVELKPEVVEFRTLHQREEELYFYDAFALPWEKDKHYKMVYQLEKKYFPDHCLDKAFLDDTNVGPTKMEKKVEMNKKMVFFDEEEVEEKKDGGGDGGEKGGGEVVSEKKVAEFFKSLKKVPGKNVGEVRGGEDPFLASRTMGLPRQWDSPSGTVVLVNKPKGVSLLAFTSWVFICM